MANILVVDDAESVLDSLAILLSKGRHSVHLASDLGTARQVLISQRIDVVVIGGLFEPAESQAFVNYLRGQLPETALVLVEAEWSSSWQDAADPQVHQLAQPLTAERLLSVVDDAVS